MSDPQQGADLTQEEACSEATERAVEGFGGLDIVVNNIAYQQPVSKFEDITTEPWDRTFRTNIYSYFWVTRAAMPHLREGAAIIKPMEKAAHPDDIAPSYIFFASERFSGYYTGEVLAPIGGETLRG